jgi:exonuclease SbcC
MKILSIEAERIKRLKAVNLKLDGGHLVVVGKPDEGKTTSIDLVWLALQTKAIGPETVSHGADEGKITVVLGEPGKRYTVTRRIMKDGSHKLAVKSDEGGKFGATFLDTLVSGLTFDPTEFLRADARKQADMLLKVVALPEGESIDKLDKDRAKAYEERTVANRELERAKAKLPAEAPETVEEVSVAARITEIEQEIEAARKTNARNQEKRDLLEKYKKQRDEVAAEIVELDTEIEELQAKLREAQAKREAAAEQERKIVESITKGKPVVAALQDVDLAPIQARRTAVVEDAEKVNAKARAYQDYLKAKKEVEALTAAPAKLTAEIESIDARKKALLDLVNWPVPGLGIRDGAVTFNGTILAQCGTSVRMRVSFAIACAMNPKLRTIRMDEGESLGLEGRTELLRMAEEKDFQVLMTVVKDGPAEDGELEIIEDTLTNVPAAVEAPAETVEA